MLERVGLITKSVKFFNSGFKHSGSALKKASLVTLNSGIFIFPKSVNNVSYCYNTSAHSFILWNAS